MRGDDQFALLFIAGETSKPSIVVPNATPISDMRDELLVVNQYGIH